MKKSFIVINLISLLFIVSFLFGSCAGRSQSIIADFPDETAGDTVAEFDPDAPAAPAPEAPAAVVPGQIAAAPEAPADAPAAVDEAAPQTAAATATAVSAPVAGTGTLDNGDWIPEVKSRLENLIAQNAGQGKKVIIDFDNTLICRDIGEATFASMVGDKKITSRNIPANITPSGKLNNTRVDIADFSGPAQFYNNFLSVTKEQPEELSPYSNGYVWLTQIMAGMTPADIASSTEKAYANGIARLDRTYPNLQETKVNGYLQPFFYPEMVDLTGLLVKNGYDVYIFSTSNTWTARWIVLKHLNPLIQAKYGAEAAIAPDHVIGISVLVEDNRTGIMHQDSLLAKTNQAYANMDIAELTNYRLTTQVVYPLTGYFGQLANIFKFVSYGRPFLVAGDSPNDHPMLNQAENRLWITRLEKMEYQEKTLDLIENSLPGEWMLQPVLFKESPGFVASQDDVNKRLHAKPFKKKTPNAVIKMLRTSGKLKGF